MSSTGTCERSASSTITINRPVLPLPVIPSTTPCVARCWGGSWRASVLPPPGGNAAPRNIERGVFTVVLQSFLEGGCWRSIRERVVDGQTRGVVDHDRRGRRGHAARGGRSRRRRLGGSR